ncbi:hypothetical protein BOX15_Mlig031769g1 [Macrostomum lignano]|uniref:Bicarbonate transporter-like transmembrane domain-containing protein n=1 Tax=Macrostomum lignano TaxID=282301 RepID=A0A267H2A6_9PLAT|nr:hypothetical protein BOX15_Mlig031769g1 [Macrostomum lignano]
MADPTEPGTDLRQDDLAPADQSLFNNGQPSAQPPSSELDSACLLMELPAGQHQQQQQPPPPPQAVPQSAYLTLPDHRLPRSRSPSSRGRQHQRRGSGSSAASVDRDNLSIMSGGSLAMFYRNADGTDESLPCLVVSRLEKIPLKDFSSEIRANMDIQRFLKEATLLLDVEGANVECIIEQMLRSIFRADHESHHSSGSGGGGGDGGSVAGAAGAIDSRLDAKVQDAKKTLFLQANWMDYTYQRLAKTIKSISVVDSEGLITDNSWLCTMCSLNGVQKRHVAIARLSTPVNLGRSSEGVSFILLVVTPTKEKGTKSDIELGRTFATILADSEFRQKLLLAETESEFKEMLQGHAHELGEEQKIYRRKSLRTKDFMSQAFSYESSWPICNGIRADLKRRLSHYLSDFIDAFRDNKTIRKVVTTVIFLYFACLMPCIAFGVLNNSLTNGYITVHRVILSQCIGGVTFALFGGQPLIVMLTTAPLALYTHIIFELSQNHGLDFFAFFGWVGVFNAALLLLYAVLDLSKLMRWSTRSTEEIFAMFISVAFTVGAVKSVYGNFDTYYCDGNGGAETNGGNLTSGSDKWGRNLTLDSQSALNGSSSVGQKQQNCQRDVSILFLLLCIGTVFLSMYLLNFTKTPYLNRAKRELMADFSLPVSVLAMSFVGTYLFRNVQLENFSCLPYIQLEFVIARPLPGLAILGAFGLAIPLSMLFFMEQNISSAMVNCPANKLRKGSAYHLDLLTVALMNGVMSCFGLPWVHGALPHSPLHVKALADLEERIDLGQHVHQSVVRVRETRITGVVSNILIGLSLLMCPVPLSFIPVPVLDGLFVCMAITALFDNQLFERILLLFTEQAAYPPSHYLRRVPQRKVHIFTCLQLLQLFVLCALGFNSIAYAKLGFPVILFLQMPVRHLLIPKLIDENYLDALDKPM